MIFDAIVIGALAAEAKSYKLPAAGWVALAFFFGSMALLPWVAAVLGRASTMLSGTIIAVLMALITGLFAGPVFALVVLAIAAPAGFLLDFLVTRDYQRAKREKKKPSWWAGGSWMGP